MADARERAIEIDENPELEHTEWRIERITWIGLIVLMAAIALGVFGDGLLSRAEAAAAGDTLRVRYERFCRFGASIRMVVEAPASADGTAAVAIDRAFVDAFAVQQVAPQPGSVRAVVDGVEYDIPARPGARVRIVFELQPVQRGLVQAMVRAHGHAVSLTQFVYP